MTSTAPELALVMACLCRPLDEQARVRIAELASSPLGWERLLGWTRRHRVTSLVFDALGHVEDSKVPPAIFDRLRSAARLMGFTSLQQIAATARLMRALAEADIGALVLKGPVLSQIAFGSPTLRDSSDIDLLIEPAAFVRANVIL